MIWHISKRLVRLVLLILIIGISFGISRPSAAEDRRVMAQSALSALQAWYDPNTGLWNSTGWWEQR